MNETLDYALFYISYSLSVIPLRHGEKVPLVKWEQYQRAPPSIAEVQKWFKDTASNIAIVCGKVSGNLVVIDFDDVEVYNKFLKEIESNAELKDIIENTWLVQTGKGYHIYLRVDTDKPIKIGKLPKVDIKGEGGYVVAPPSLHPSGKNYEFVRFTNTTGHEIMVISEEQYGKLLAALEKVTGAKLSLVNEQQKKEEKEEKNGSGRFGRKLNDEQIMKIVKALEPVYKPEHRHNIILYLTGWMYNRRIDYESAEKLVKAICEHYHDEECNNRLYTLKDTYGIGRTPREEVLKAEGSGLKTKSGLYKEITQIASEEVAKSIVLTISNTIDPPREAGVIEERPIESFDTLRVYHDFQHGKAYVSTYKAVIQKIQVKTKEEVVTTEEKVVKIASVFVNDGGKIKILTDTDEIKDEYLEIEDLNVAVKQYPKLNLPTGIFDNVKIAEVFKETLSFISQRIDTARPEDKIAIVIWAIATYFVPIFDFFPFLAPLKMGFNSGGSELLETLKKIVPRPVSVSDITPANIYRMQENFQPTLLIDELRDNINKDTFNALYSILVAGYRRGVTVPRIEKSTEDPRLFEPFGAKAIIDQSLITSHYDMASRCLFVRLQRNPNRISDYTNGANKDLIDKFYSVFLFYAPNAYQLYKNMKDSGFTGRYDQVFRPLITIARLIDQEDPTLRVEEQLRVVLDDSKAFAEALSLEGDPQKKIAILVVEFVKDSIGEFIEGKTNIIPKPWHIFESGEGEGEVYIFVSDLRKKVTEYAMSLHQKDVAFRYDENGRSAVSEREWSTVEPELAEMLKSRQFTALLKKFFPSNVKEHRTKMIFIISRDDWNKLNFQQPPSEPDQKTKKADFGNFSGVLNISQSDTKNSAPLNNPRLYSNSGSDFGSEIKIQKNEVEKENTKTSDELSFNSSLQSTDKNTESGITNSAQNRLGFGSEIKSQSRNSENSGSKQNSMAQGLTAHQQQILDFLKKLSERRDSAIRLAKLSKDELKLLPELREKGYANFDNNYVWLTFDGYAYLTDRGEKREVKENIMTEESGNTTGNNTQGVGEVSLKNETRLLELCKQYSGTVRNRKELQDELGLRAYELLEWCEKRNLCHWVDEERVRFD